MTFSENCCILLLLLCILVSARGYNSETFKACIFGCIGVKTVELALQVLWLLKFLQRKLWSSSLLVRAAIRRLSKFELFACGFKGTIFDILLTISKSFA